MPERPDRPDRPERPERPEPPDRPERPDDELYDVVRRVWEERDPVPAGLVARLQATTALAAGDADLDLELMTLVERSQELAGARSSGTQGSSYTLRFAHDGVDLLVRVQGAHPSRGTRRAGARRPSVGPGAAGGGARIDCWLVPPSPVTVRVLVGDTVDHADSADTADGPAIEVSTTGRFEAVDLPAGLVRLRIEPTDGSPAFVTPAFEI